MQFPIHLLQLWSWERLHVGRPVRHVPQNVQLEGMSVGYRWNIKESRQIPPSNISRYRDELDGLLDSQVTWEPYTPDIRSQIAPICLMGEDIWLSNTVLISWTRAEWHIPNRVQRQFGLVPPVHLPFVDPAFIRTDGRGKSDTDWMVFYESYIGMWEDRRARIVKGTQLLPENAHLIGKYLKWYRSWAQLYILNAPKEPPRSYYEHAPIERHFRDFFNDSEATLQSLFGREDLGPAQTAINHMEELIKNMHNKMHISNEQFFASLHTPFRYFNDSQPPPESTEPGPSSQAVRSPVFLSDLALWPSDTDFEDEPVRSQGIAEQQINHPSDDDFVDAPDIQRLRRRPQKYTPGTDAIPRRKKKRK